MQQAPHLHIVTSSSRDVYLNLAVESALLEHYDPNTITLFLWQNDHTVVIGANQNPFAECDVEQLLLDGGHLARRRTGGGAVYHDKGNLNFSFIVDKNLYDVRKQLSVIKLALSRLGLDIKISGRNDLTYQGRKFSGNAFVTTKLQALHHGTLLIKTDSEKLARYLKVNPAKLHKHGVQSVASRVLNLTDVLAITAESIQPYLHSAFQEVYQGKAEFLDFQALITPKVIEHSQFLQSDDYLYGKWRQFSAKRSDQFAWGIVDIDLSINEIEHKIDKIAIASDSLDTHTISTLQQLLVGTSLNQKPILPGGIDSTIANDILSLIY